MRDAVQSLMRYIPLHNEAIYLLLEEHRGKAIIRVEIRTERPPRQGVELAVGVLYRVLRLLVKTQWRPQVCFAHDAPRQAQTHRRMFGDNVRFGCDFNGIVCRPKRSGSRDTGVGCHARTLCPTVSRGTVARPAPAPPTRCANWFGCNWLRAAALPSM